MLLGWPLQLILELVSAVFSISLLLDLLQQDEVQEKQYITNLRVQIPLETSNFLLFSAD